VEPDPLNIMSDGGAIESRTKRPAASADSSSRQPESSSAVSFAASTTTIKDFKIEISRTERTMLLQDADNVKDKINDHHLFQRLIALIIQEENATDVVTAAPHRNSTEEEEDEDGSGISNKRHSKRQDFPNNNMLASSSLNRDDRVMDEPTLELQVFLDTLIDAISDSTWGGTTIRLEYPKADHSVSGRILSKLEAKDALKQRSTASVVGKVWVSQWTEEASRMISYEPKDYLKSKIYAHWYYDANHLTTFLRDTHSLVRSAHDRDHIDLVQRTPDMAPSNLLIKCQLDKAHAIVVAGESGSGKSFFSVKGPLSCNTEVFYCVMTSTDFNGTCPPPEYPVWHGLILKVMQVVDDTDTAFMDSLRRAKSSLSISRNAWAISAAENGLNRKIASIQNSEVENSVRSWFKGNWDKAKRPSKLAIVLDEATNQHFAYGMVDSVRYFLRKYERLVSESIHLIIVGTGLDLINFEQDGGRLGTDPTKSRVIVMKQPKIDLAIGVGQACDASPNTTNQAIFNSINAGSFSRILATNTRMFFNGILFVMKSTIFAQEANDQDNRLLRLQERLTLVGSFRPAMDYAVRMYVASNSVGQLERSQRTKLLEECFVHHLHTAVSEARNRGGDTAMLRSLKSELKIIEAFDCTKRLLSNDNEGENIFERGLASKSGTSLALKYLACFGLTERVEPGFGDTLETMTRMHVARYADVQGFAPILRQLKHGWPPAARVKGQEITKSNLEALAARLEKQCEEEMANLAVPGGKGNRCYIMWQGTPNAQGPDVFALFVTEDKLARLDCIQCKNHKKAPGIASEWWMSLGYNLQAEKTDDSPSDGSAGWSYTGLQGLMKCLSNLVGLEVTLGRRIVATSLLASDLGSVTIPKDGVVWCRELLEPTISLSSPPQKYK
jgi:hypothetical protein